MAYIPPHKRHSAGKGKAPTPESIAPIFQRTLNFRPHSGDNHRKCFPNDFNAASNYRKWFPVGLGSCFGYSDSDGDKFMSFTKLEPVSSGSSEIMLGAKPHALILDHDRINGYVGERGVVLENPWDFIADKVKQDLFSDIQRVQEKMKDNDRELIKPSLVARFGRVIFKGDSPTLSDLKQVFDVHVSPSFVEHVLKVFPNHRIDVELQKECYYTRLSRNMEPKLTFWCKCILAEDGETLQLYKIEPKKDRYFVSDMSCLGKSLDLRLILITKRTENHLTDDEIKCIRSLISTAVVDPEVKGGLKWPLGRNSSGDRYTVVASWHVKTKIVMIKNSSIKLKVRNENRFTFRSSLARTEVYRVVFVDIDVKSQLQMQPMQEDLFIDTLRNNLKLIWNNFVCSPSTA